MPEERVRPPRPAEIQAPLRTPITRQMRAAAVRVPAQVQKTLADVVRLLAAVVARLRMPLLLVLLAPVLPGLVLIAVSALRGGRDVPISIVVAALGQIPGAWLAVRRRQLLRALQPPDQAAAEIYAMVALPDAWVRVKSNLGQIAEEAGELRLRSLGRKIWRGVKLGADLRDRLGSSPRLAPFLPGRLRGVAFLAGSCLASFALLWVLAVVKVIASAAGIG